MMSWAKRNNAFSYPALLAILAIALMLLNAGGALAEETRTQIGSAGELNYFFSSQTYCANQQAHPEYMISAIICDFVGILDGVLVNVYNGVRTLLIPVVQAALTLYIAIFGAQIVMGTAQATPGEIITRLLKVAAVWLFATRAEYGVGVAFNFYMGFIADVGEAIINSLAGNMDTGLCNNLIFPALDRARDPSNALPLFSFFDQLVLCAFTGPANAGGLKLQGFFLTMVPLFPPISLLFGWWMMTTGQAIAQTMLSFLTSISAIAFLIALSPLFLGFMLFQVTSHFFDNWLKYLIGYSVQIVVTFGITVLWILMMLQFILFFDNLSKVIFHFTPGQYIGGFWNESDTWAICAADYTLETPICTPSAPADQNVAAWNAFRTKLIPPSKIVTQSDFLTYVCYNLIALLVLSYAFSQLLENAHQIASSLAGPGAPIPKIKSGIGTKGMGSLKGMGSGGGMAPAGRGSG